MYKHLWRRKVYICDKWEARILLELSVLAVFLDGIWMVSDPDSGLKLAIWSYLYLELSSLTPCSSLFRCVFCCFLKHRLWLVNVNWFLQSFKKHGMIYGLKTQGSSAFKFLNKRFLKCLPSVMYKDEIDKMLSVCEIWNV